MCIIILNKKNSTLSDDILKNSFLSNPDGSGFAYSINNKLYIIKGIFELDKFIETYKTIKEVSESDILIHCRISTGGKIDKNNCHPHIIHNDCCLAHNGILNIKPTKTKSDTKVFIDTYLKNFSTDDLMFNTSLIQLIEFSIGLENKFVLMNNSGQTTIYNQQSGHIDTDNNWYSNLSYKITQTINNYSIIDYQLYDLIESLTPDDFSEIGSDPYIDLQTLSLYREKLFDDSDFMKLSKYSPEIYDYYLELRLNSRFYYNNESRLYSYEY